MLQLADVKGWVCCSILLVYLHCQWLSNLEIVPQRGASVSMSRCVSFKPGLAPLLLLNVYCQSCVLSDSTQIAFVVIGLPIMLQA